MSVNLPASFCQALGSIEQITDPHQIAKLSKDYFDFSPLLPPLLADKVADLVVRPQTEADILTIAQACVNHKIPLTVRGAGTGNYGQCVPLAGGIVLDMSKLNQVKWVKPGILRAEAGAKLSAIDKVTRPQGWELRMVPSTYRSATLGGFIGGGSGGIGSVTYGQLRDRGNILAARVITLEPTPRVLELRSDDIYKVNHAYGTTGIITELEMPLAPNYPWAEIIVTFEDFITAARFGQALCDADGIQKKLVSIHAWPIPSYFAALQPYLPTGQTAALLMVAESSLEALQALVQDWEGNITYQKTAEEAAKGSPLAEFTWNHTTLHARSVDPHLTYLQTLFPYDPDLTLLKQLTEQYADELIMHLEFMRVQGRHIPAALQLVRYTTPDRLNAIITDHEAQGAFIANPHTYLLEDGGMKQVDEVQLAFKQQVDPYGLLNPGKMRAWDQRPQG